MYLVLLHFVFITISLIFVLVSFGGTTANEMCMEFVYVYPAAPSVYSCGANSNSTPSNGNYTLRFAHLAALAQARIPTTAYVSLFRITINVF